MTDDVRSIRDLVEFAIGGGWGDEQPSDGSEPVAIIRGADFPAVELGDVRNLPVRYETKRRKDSRLLRPDDIVLEVSGGTKDRPTGRTVFVSERLLSRSLEPVIPASFCRLLRAKKDLVDPGYLYYWLRNMHSVGRAWGYQIQSTGLSNFQFESFLDAEQVRLPPLPKQRAIAEVMGSLDALIDQDHILISTLRATAASCFQQIAAGSSRTVLLRDVAVVNPLRVTPKKDGGITYVDIASVGDGSLEWPPQIPWTTAPSRARRGASSGDTLWSTVRPNRRAHGLLVRAPDSLVVSTGLAVLSPRSVGPAYLYAAADQQSFTDFLVSRAEGSAYPAVRPDAFLDAPIPFASQSEMDAYEALAWPMWQMIDALQSEMADALRTRDELMPRLLDGDVAPHDGTGD